MEKDIIKLIDFWKGTLKDKNIYLRLILDNINLKSKEISVLTGIRRSGKSSVLNLIINDLDIKDKSLYINFEDPFFVENNSPTVIGKIISVYKEYFNKNLKYLFFDEIQNIEKWEHALRKLRDSEQYKIFITGSSSKLLSREISSLITGRHLSYEMFPLSFREFLFFNGFGKITKKDLVSKEEAIKKRFSKYAKMGGFPEVVLTKNFQLLKNYFYDILYKDIVARYDIREKDVLEKIALFLVSNYSKIVTVESLKKNYGVSFDLVSKYLEYLKESFLIFELLQFSFSLKRQVNLPKKNYVIDTGLAQTVGFQFSDNIGRILENMVFLELKRQGCDIYYYKNVNECDFVVKDGNKITDVIQVTKKLTQENKKRETKGLADAMDNLGVNKGLILTENQEENIKIGSRKINILPVWKWMLE